MSGTLRLSNLDHQVQGLTDCLRRAVGDERAPSRISFDQTFFAEGLHRLAYCGTAHSKALRQLAFGGKLVAGVGSGGNALTAIDPKTGKKVWRHPWPGGGGGGQGLLTTAGKVLFTGDGNGNLIAFDVANGKPRWHTRIGNISNGPQTYMLDGRQYMLVAVGDTLYAFALY